MRSWRKGLICIILPAVLVGSILFFSPFHVTADSGWHLAAGCPIDAEGVQDEIVCGPGILRRWGPSMIVPLLFLMTLGLYGLAIAIDRALYFGIRGTLHQKRSGEVHAFLETGDVMDAATFAVRHPKDHRARLTRAGIVALRSAREMNVAADIELELVRNALTRTLAELRQYDRCYIRSLATIGWTALMTGPVGVAWLFVNVSQGVRVAEGAGLAAIAGGVAESLIPMAIGLLIGIPALWGYSFFHREAQKMEGRSAEFAKAFLSMPTRRHE